MGRFGLCGGSYTAQSRNVDDEQTMNLICEVSGSPNAKTSLAMFLVPGKQPFCKLPESSIPYDFTVNGRTFAAASNLYEVLSSGNFVLRGSLGAPPTGPTQIIANQVQILILNNGNLYVMVLASNAFFAVNMAQFNGPVLQIGFTDGYGIATIQNSNTFQVSNLEDFNTWGGLNISTISLFPDNIVSMIINQRQPWFLSGKKSAGYYNAGAGFPPFIPQQGAFFENGCGATWATVQADNSFFWLDQDERGSMIARRASGATPQRISNHAIEFAWQSYATTSDATAYSYQQQGHTFWVIRFPAANKTWVYDVSTGLWAERGAYTNGSFSADHSQCHTFNFGKHLVGDWATGNIYELSTTVFTDNGHPIKWVRRSPTIAKEQQWISHQQIEIDVEVGLGPEPPLFDGDNQPRAPEIMLRWSDDGGKTWSNTYTLECGQGGDYGSRAVKRMLGRSRRRVYEISGTDPIPWRICDGYLRASPDYEHQERYTDQMRKIS